MDNDTEIKIQLEDIFSDLEDPVEAQENARQRAIFSALVQNATDAISISDLQGRQIYSNLACYKIFGYDYEFQEMKGAPMTDFWPKDDASIFTDQVLPQARDTHWSGEVRQKRKDGTLFDAHLTVFPVVDGTDAPISIATIIRDISEQKRVERERDQDMYETRSRQVQLVTEIAQEIAAAPTLNELYRRTVTLVKERLGYYHVQVFRHVPEQDAMVVIESYVRPEETTAPAKYKMPYGKGVVGAAAATAQPVLISRVSQDPNWLPHPGLSGVKGELAVPIKLRGEVLGVLDVFSDRANALIHEDTIVLLDLTSQIASAIENVRLLEEANVVRQFAQAPEGIGWITLEGNVIIYVNPTLCNIFGEAQPENTFGKPLTSYYPKELRERVQNEILPAVVREGQWVGELELLTTQGKIVSTVQSFFLIHDESGNPLYIASVISDITEQKQAEILLDKRVRQINCLNEIGRKIEETPPISEFLPWVTERISVVMQHLEAHAVAIEFNGQLYGVAKAVALPHQIVEDLCIGDQLMGHMYIACAQKHDFLDDERSFVSDVARRVSSYIESRHLLERAKLALEEAKAAHRLYVHNRWNEPASSLAQEAQPDGVASDDAQSKDRLKKIGPYSALRGMWQRITTGLFIVAALIMLGVLFTWTASLQAQAEPTREATATLHSGGSSAEMMVMVQPSVASPTPTSTVPSLPLTESHSMPSSAPITNPVEALLPSPTLAPNTLVAPEPFPVAGPREVVPSTTLVIPTPVQPVPVAPDAINIAVLGSDQRPDWSEWHTDVIQIVSVQRDRGAVSVISVPRDLYVYIPGLWMSRINFADFYGEDNNYEGGGPALLRDALLYNLGIRMDYYVRTNFDGLIGIVDTVGGVDIPVHCRLSDYWPYPDENGEYPVLTMEPGVHHMDGETALWYARSRKTTSVFARERRQQQVLQALWHTGRDAGMLTRVPALWKQGQDMVMTDLTLTDILDLARVALSLDDKNVRFYNIGSNEVIPWITPYGGSVFLPRWEQIQPVVAEAMAPIPEARLGRTYMPVEVWNGTANPDWDRLAADRLYRAGFPAVIGEPDRQDYAVTQLIIFSESTKGTGAEYLQQIFGLSDNQIVHRPGESSEFDFRLILGADYQVCPEP